MAEQILKADKAKPKPKDKQKETGMDPATTANIAIALANAAVELYNKWKNKPKPQEIDPNTEIKTQIGIIVSRLENLESFQTDQTDIIKQTTEELKSISNDLAKTSIKSNTGIVLAIIAIIVSVAALMVK